jgi:Putative zinc-finger
MMPDSRREEEDSMPHVDEGTLHAYLDGELSPSERTAVDAHLAQCASCAAQLIEERALIERASAVLGGARPADRAAPPLQELTQRPRRSGRILGVRAPLAWAATVILALGIGYYLHTPGPVTPPPPAVAIGQNLPATSTAVAEKPEPRQLARTGGARADRSREQTGKANAQNTLADTGVQVAAQQLSSPAVQTPAEPRAQLRGAAPARAPVVAPEPAAAARVDDAFRRTDSLAALRGRLVSSQWTIISKGSARTLLGTDPVGVPGLAARAIRRSPTDGATIVVEQQLDSETVIELYQRAATVEAGAAGYAAKQERAPTERLARYVGALRVEIAGPLTPDSLNRLLEQVKPLP